MLEISNLRKYAVPGTEKVRLEVDMNFTDMPSPYSEKTIFFEIDKAHADMLIDDSYDPFVLVPLYLAMLHKQDLYIRGNISKKFFQNIKYYIPQIFLDFLDTLSPVNVTVDGVNSFTSTGTVVGTGISCGVDSLSTLYDHFICEDDPDYRINALFYFNCGIFGEFGDARGLELTLSRGKPGQKLAAELGLPLYRLDSNLHAFRKQIDLNKLNFISVYSCAISLGNAVSKYYVSSGTNYEEIKHFSNHYHNSDMSGFSESYLVPLIQTERTRLIIDGCQYRRVDKLKNIVDWEITKKYLNVCWRYTPDGSNCTLCPKCLRTLFPLEIMGKLDDYKNVFDLEKYRAISFQNKVACLQGYGEDPFATENVDFARENNFPLPSKREAYILDGKVLLT